MGRDTSVVSAHSAAVSDTIRSIIPAENHVEAVNGRVRFSVKPFKLHLFDAESEESIPFVAE